MVGQRHLFAMVIAAASLGLFDRPALAQASAPPPTPDQIIARARGHITARGASWASGEAQRLRNGEINPQQVERDAAAVTNGIQPGADVDELVLVALVDARGAPGGSPRQALAGMEGPSSNDAKPARSGAGAATALQRAIDDVVQKLTDTQMPTQKPLH